jgi:hypothetical protein
MDIEGAELMALRGARRLLASEHAPRLLFLEVHPHFLPAFGATPADVDALLSTHRYEVMVRHARGDQIHVMAIRR